MKFWRKSGIVLNWGTYIWKHPTFLLIMNHKLLWLQKEWSRYSGNCGNAALQLEMDFNSLFNTFKLNLENNNELRDSIKVITSEIKKQNIKDLWEKDTAFVAGLSLIFLNHSVVEIICIDNGCLKGINT